jgi:electron transfer flavoprotein beta subunit|tara:strand:- start:910 stop:1674 length:765 start_codon:yes stop_codon:yes gene_type:complete
MKIAVLTKAIPSYESSIRVDSSGKWIDESVVNYVVNESDSYALEEALQIKENIGDGSEVVVVTLGSESNTSKVIKDGLAKGADRGILIKNESATTDPLSIAKLFSEHLRAENFDLVFSGLQSDDMGAGQTGVLIGEMLDMSTATLAIETQVESDKIKVKRELESGWFQWVTLSLPASISIQSGINEPRYPSLKGIMGAKRKELNTFDGSAENQSQNFVNLYVPKNEKFTEKIEGDTDTIVAKIMDVLKNKLKVI